jgi:uncharacterized protein (TIGR02145 family)
MLYKSILNAVAVAVAVSAVMFVGCVDNGVDNDNRDNGGNGGGGPPTATKGTFTDSRDGTIYKTVKIGTQTWMAENLNYDAGRRVSVCSGNSEEGCAEYGRLYDWETAKRVCPDGWHLPSYTEWNVLIKYVGGSETAGTKLKSSTGWENYTLVEVDGRSTDLPVGTDTYGFSALPGGGINFYDVVYWGAWWSATESSPDYAWVLDMGYDREHVNRWCDLVYTNLLHSVRCVQN